ncbi:MULTISPECIES: outer membrane protein assembly factor BamC [Pseudoalteromonas]|uniref:Outer membrane assembly protein BamC n=1 Tax=Pseudoalteromonas amylolytica TaxID=1859457 RepID=A0A1S1MQ75_9GAMM|nr:MULTISPECIES: outer membrane protein assembly factor BamC [Pseudoalteromonas]OHU86601.1 outer membrane assembly protein BamC [Pseudoalteromonas sp. JW3]OHU88874.1 outer membrane assembly protein BamC [Pseudoalteromonas amylolytica]
MQYWIPKTLAFSVLIGLSGCSVFTNDAHHKRNYRVNEPVKVPAHLQQPSQDPTYKMPVASFDSDPVAKSYRPPQQVLTVAKGSWVEENEGEARVYFDKNDGIDDLPAFIWKAVDSVMAGHTVALEQDNREQGFVTTGWYSLIKPVEGWFWEDDVIVSEQKVRFTVEQKEHQRTASLRAELLDYRSDNAPLNDLLKQQLEARAVNEVVAEFDYLYRLLEVQMRKQQGVLSLVSGFDDDGNGAMITEQKRDIVIDRFAGFLERVNFTIIKIDRDNGLISTRYEKPQDSVWDSIWGDEAVQLPIESGDYKISVATVKDGSTSITWRDAQGDVLDTDVMAQLQQVLVEVLRDKGLTI